MGILHWFGARKGGAADAPDRRRIDEAVERMVQTTNPRLRLARRYQARLGPAVGVSLAYVHDLVATLPAARDASAAGWGRDPYIRTFFATADSIGRALSSAPDLRAYFQQNPGAPEAYAALGMEMAERKILGMALEGDAVRGEVAQTTVSFGDHRVRICGRTEPELREEIERRMIDQLALEGLARIGADKSRRTELKQERALLKTRLNLLERQGAGMRAALGADAAAPEDVARLQSQMEENTRNLDALGGDAQTLDAELEHIRAVLAEPAQHFYVSSRRLRLDRMNVVIEGGSAREGAELEFLVARIPGATPALVRAFSLVRIPRTEMLSADRMVADAARMVI